MKIGIYLGEGLPNARAGGGFTLQATLLDELNKVHCSHQFILFYYGTKTPHETENKNLCYISLQKYESKEKDFLLKKMWLKIVRSCWGFKIKKKYTSLLNLAVLENNVDLMWFMTPAYEYVEVPYLYTVWDLQHRRQTFFPEVSVTGSTFEEREKHYQSIIPKATYVITGNQVAKEEVIRFYGIPDERVKTLEFPTPNFALVPYKNEINVVQKFCLNPPYLFYPAQFWPHKNHMGILHAVKKLKEQHNLYFSIVFTGADKGNLYYIKEQVDKLRLKRQIFFLGFISIEELVALYKNAFALIYPSFFGPNNLPPLEAFALGCSVIAANVAGAAEQLGDAALLFDPKNPVELVNYIKKLHDDFNLKEQLVKLGLERAKNWTSKDYIQGIIKIIDEFEPIRCCWSSNRRYVHL